MLFESDDWISKVASLTREDADKLPFGVVRLDNKGKILLYNEYEAELGEVEIDEAEGRNFFLEIAPCTNNSLFRGRFEEGMKKGELDHTFDYTFTYKIDPTSVRVRMYHEPSSKTNWVFVVRDEE